LIHVRIYDHQSRYRFQQDDNFNHNEDKSILFTSKRHTDGGATFATKSSSGGPNGNILNYGASFEVIPLKALCEEIVRNEFG